MVIKKGLVLFPAQFNGYFCGSELIKRIYVEYQV